jgi:protease PrsW
VPDAPPPPPPPVPAPHPPGWYPDPWQRAAWRWWDGTGWTVHLAPGRAGPAEPRKPRLPSWLSPPVLVAGILTVPLVFITLLTAPVAVLLGLVPLVIVLPVLAFLDRVEPEPRPSKVHAVLWGGTIAALVSGVVNTVVLVASSEAVAAVVSAPLIEETMKGLGVYWAVRRREVDSVMDGLVYAGWVGLGFAVVENFDYFALAAVTGVLAETFVLRALLTPFAHPLFTAWTGLAIGLAVSRGRPVWPRVLWGWALAVAAHAAWNGSLVLTERTEEPLILGVAAVAFVALFAAAVVMVLVVRRREQRRYVDSVPMLAHRYGVDPAEAAVFGHWKTMLATRRTLPPPQRRRFDQVHAALARLSALHARPGEPDPVDEAILVEQLQRARRPG